MRHGRTSPGADDDGDLLVAVARGDRDAYDRLYRRHGATLLGLLHRMLADRAEAEDVLHEVFLQVWRRARDFDAARGDAFVWLTTVARNRALDRLEALASRRRTLVRATAAVVERAADPADAASSCEERRRLVRALAQIPDAERDVLLLAYFGGLTQPEIAARLDRPLGTVKSHARLGLGRLRALLCPARAPRWSGA
ncbi:MAG TPA: sigma-70 family RNA polymerase sigma factor [Candidatus Binatia bacterium]|nr:sigma-70 family RNA polymerase sigma factor [Candidatus Binatia bacterium]